jgi:hypothetical protein
MILNTLYHCQLSLPTSNWFFFTLYIYIYIWHKLRYLQLIKSHAIDQLSKEQPASRYVRHVSFRNYIIEMARRCLKVLQARFILSQEEFCIDSKFEYHWSRSCVSSCIMNKRTTIIHHIIILLFYYLQLQLLFIKGYILYVLLSFLYLHVPHLSKELQSLFKFLIFLSEFSSVVFWIHRYFIYLPIIIYWWRIY